MCISCVQIRASWIWIHPFFLESESKSNQSEYFLGLNPNPNPNPAQKALNLDLNPNPDMYLMSGNFLPWAYPRLIPGYLLQVHSNQIRIRTSSIFMNVCSRGRWFKPSTCPQASLLTWSPQVCGPQQYDVGLLFCRRSIFHMEKYISPKIALKQG